MIPSRSQLRANVMLEGFRLLTPALSSIEEERERNLPPTL